MPVFSSKDSYFFVVPGEPVAKGRPKFTTRSGFVRAITPEKTANYETLVKLSFSQEYPEAKPFEKDTPLSVYIIASFGIPKSVSKKKAQEMTDCYIRPTKKPDCDNIGKIICDALNGIAFHDDSQIVELTINKYYSDTPQVRVCIEKWNDGREKILTRP